jgi:hypothetical protein
VFGDVILIPPSGARISAGMVKGRRSNVEENDIGIRPLTFNLRLRLCDSSPPSAFPQDAAIHDLLQRLAREQVGATG